MLKIIGTKIFLTRGDSAYLTLSIQDNTGKNYELNDGDKVSVQVRTSPNTGDLIFMGTIEYIDEQIVWHIVPTDTANLPVTTYYWDAQIETGNGDIFTFIPSSPFKLLDEVTFHEYKC